MGEDEVEEAEGNSTDADPSYLFHDGRSGQPKGGLGGGWTVVLTRAQAGNKEEYFYRAWGDYLLGFGHLNSAFWRGLGNNQAMAATEVPGRDGGGRVGEQLHRGGGGGAGGGPVGAPGAGRGGAGVQHGRVAAVEGGRGGTWVADVGGGAVGKPGVEGRGVGSGGVGTSAVAG